MPYKDPAKQRAAALKSANKSYQKQTAELRDIGRIPKIRKPNLKRRDRCRYDLKEFLKSYFPAMFPLPWSDSQLKLISEIQDKVLHGGLKAVAMPRGSGKSTICGGAVQWAVSYGHRRFVYFIRSDQGEAESSLRTIRIAWETNRRLAADFPELAHPIHSLGGSAARAKLQMFNGERTYIQWSGDELHFPCLSGFEYLDPNASVVIKTSGIGGSIRGSQHSNPATGEILRPDFVLLDDVQTDKVAGSPASCDKLIDLIDGAIKGLAGPGELMSGVMPCTVIHDGDVSDTYLDQTLKPEWHGMRCSMVISWPKGITDEEISDETETSRLWLEYSRIRVQSLADNGDISAATAFYKRNRRKMDSGFIIDWKHRFNGDERFEGNREISAIQCAMELRFANIFTFNSEYQNKPKRSIGGVSSIPTAERVLSRVTKYERGVLPMYCKHLVGMIDVQDETLWYTMIGLGLDYSGIVTAYGSWPKLPYRYFTKAQTLRWKRLSSAFYEAHPDYPRPKSKSDPGPFEAKLRYALESLCDLLLKGEKWKYEDGSEIQPSLLAVDVRWGQAAEVVKRFIREYGDPRIRPYEGYYVGASSKQLADFSRKDGSIFEDQVHRGVNVCRWIAKPEPGGGRKIMSDVNRWKSFLMNRLASPIGAPGSLVIHSAESSDHELFVHHLTKSERPEIVTARGRSLSEWHVIPSSGVDNDYLDCSTGCMCLGSMLGCRIQEDFTAAREDAAKVGRTNETGTRAVSEQARKKRVKVSELMNKRKGSRRSGSLHPALRG